MVKPKNNPKENKMKNLLVIFGLAVVLASCGSAEDKKVESVDSAAVAADSTKACGDSTAACADSTKAADTAAVGK